MLTTRRVLFSLIATGSVLYGSAGEVLHAQAATNTPPPWDITRPRGTPRIISFTTDEGTWLSPDVSPDGRTIAFDMVGDIWVVPIAGGEARALTRASGIALNFHAAWSPDGSRIAFVSDRDGQENVWIMNADGSNARRVSTQREKRVSLPAWTPDGSYVIARTGGDSNNDGRGELWMWHVDGGTGVRITGETISASWPEVSPDGRYVYHEEIVAIPGDRNPARGLYQLRRLDRQSGKVAEITSGVGPLQDGGGGRRSSGGAVAPALSPDGRWLAFARRIPDGTQQIMGHEYGPRTALWLRDLQSGAERMLMDPITTDVQERNNNGTVPRYSWMPDGRSIVLTEGGKLRRLDVASGGVTTIPFTARVEKPISERVFAPTRITDGPLDVRMMRYHTASPDGRTLAFVAVGRIWLMDLPGGTPRRLTPTEFAADEYAPAWSPDGSSLAFASWSDATHGHVWRIARTGGAPQRLTQLAGMYTNPTWSPDGQRVVVARGAGEMLRGRMPSDESAFSLEWVPAAGGEATNIIDVSSRGGRIVAPKFGPEGRVFYLESGAGGGAGGGGGGAQSLRSVRVDGFDPRVHILLDAADEAAPSPDGKWLAFARGDNIYLAPLPWPGMQGEPVRLAVSQPVLPVRRLTLEGGNFPGWVSANVLQWGSATRFFRHRVDVRTTDTTRIALQVPRPMARGVVALTGAKLVTMNGDSIIPRGDVVVRDGRIVGVGASGRVPIPAGAHRVDVSGKTIIPGMIDAHKHTAREGRDLLSQQSWEMASNLAFGITTRSSPRERRKSSSRWPRRSRRGSRWVRACSAQARRSRAGRRRASRMSTRSRTRSTRWPGSRAMARARSRSTSSVGGTNDRKQWKRRARPA
ncbi:MAG: PD40 domain-containing protein [Cytophagaceae bacterium]|nr:PD40 domain-containing protein [Gemmatimonadaceae bacterium]